MNIFEALRQDHQKQRTLVAALVKTQGDGDGREELFGRLKDELTQHAAEGRAERAGDLSGDEREDAREAEEAGRDKART